MPFGRYLRKTRGVDKNNPPPPATNRVKTRCSMNVMSFFKLHDRNYETNHFLKSCSRIIFDIFWEDVKLIPNKLLQHRKRMKMQEQIINNRQNMCRLTTRPDPGTADFPDGNGDPPIIGELLTCAPPGACRTEPPWPTPVWAALGSRRSGRWP